MSLLFKASLVVYFGLVLGKIVYGCSMHVVTVCWYGIISLLVRSPSESHYNWYKFQTPCGSFHPAIGKRSKDASSTRGR